MFLERVEDQNSFVKHDVIPDISDGTETMAIAPKRHALPHTLAAARRSFVSISASISSRISSGSPKIRSINLGWYFFGCCRCCCWPTPPKATISCSDVASVLFIRIPLPSEWVLWRLNGLGSVRPPTMTKFSSVADPPKPHLAQSSTFQDSASIF